MIRFLLQLTLVCLVAATVTSPNDCDNWFSGYTYTIEWDADKFEASIVTIELLEGLGSLIDVIAVDAPNSGEFDWVVPFYAASIECSTLGIYIQVTSPDHDSTSDTFAITNPIEWGSANIYEQYTVADSLFKVRWSGPKVPMYEIAYRELNSNDIRYVSHASDRGDNEDLDDQVISGLNPGTEYEFRMRYNRTSNSAPSEWTDWVHVTTFENLRCTDELLSAWFAIEVYDTIRTGDEKYPGFCGNWVTRFAYSSSSDFVAVYTDHESGRIIVSFRGTEGDNFEDALDNLGVLSDCDLFLTELDNNGCEMSSGFGSNYVYSAIRKISHVIEEAIRDGFDKLIVTGHSQGAALATVAALDYGDRYGSQITVDLYSYGAPEVGNEEFSDAVISKVHSIARIVQRDEDGEEDEVAGLPTSAIPVDIGFVQLDIPATYYFCPLTCRENGVFITSPFYCHCIVGYWTTTAENNIQANYIFDSLVNNVASAWYTDSGFRYTTQTVSVDVSNLISLPGSPSPNSAQALTVLVPLLFLAVLLL